MYGVLAPCPCPDDPFLVALLSRATKYTQHPQILTAAIEHDEESGAPRPALIHFGSLNAGAWGANAPAPRFIPHCARL